MMARISPDMAAAREGMVLYRKVGCPRCNRTGYKGRVGIFQLLIMNDEIEALAAQNAHRDEIERSAATAGMRSLWDDGIAKAAAGLTSLEELARVVVIVLSELRSSRWRREALALRRRCSSGTRTRRAPHLRTGGRDRASERERSRDAVRPDGLSDREDLRVDGDAVGAVWWASSVAMTLPSRRISCLKSEAGAVRHRCWSGVGGGRLLAQRRAPALRAA